MNNFKEVVQKITSHYQEARKEHDDELCRKGRTELNNKIRAALSYVGIPYADWRIDQVAKVYDDLKTKKIKHEDAFFLAIYGTFEYSSNDYIAHYGDKSHDEYFERVIKAVSKALGVEYTLPEDIDTQPKKSLGVDNGWFEVLIITIFTIYALIAAYWIYLVVRSLF
jgi:predicted metal-dependent hydrolase